MILLESLDCSLAKLSETSKGYSWFDIALAHVAFTEKGPSLEAEIERSGREWLNKRAMKWAASVEPGKLRELLPIISDHIEKGMATIVAFEGEQKKTSAGGSSPSVNASSQNTATP